MSKVSFLKSLTHKSSYWRQSNFVANMNKAFHIEENRLLQFSDVQCKYSRTIRQKVDSDWFCKPRARPVAFATTTNEMPELCTSFGKTDWHQCLSSNSLYHHQRRSQHDGLVNQ